MKFINKLLIPIACVATATPLTVLASCSFTQELTMTIKLDNGSDVPAVLGVEGHIKIAGFDNKGNKINRVDFSNLTPEVASFDENTNTIEGLSEGTAVILCKADGYNDATLELSILPPTDASCFKWDLNDDTHTATVLWFEDDGVTDVVIPSKYISDGIEYSVTAIGESAFEDISDLTTVTIPNSVTTIGDYAFASCEGLTFISIPNSVETIGIQAFYYCGKLTFVDIPSSVTNITESAFQCCSGLTSIKIDPNNSMYTSQDSQGNECNCIVEKDTNKLIMGCKNTTIPNGVITIGANAFDHVKLTSINIPNTVTTIGEEAFLCSDLTSIIIPDNVKTIGYRAFCECFNLTSADISNSINVLQNDEVFACTGLTSIIIPDNVKTIGYRTFAECSSLTFVTIGQSVQKIEDCAFDRCSSITNTSGPNETHGFKFNGTYEQWKQVSRGNYWHDLSNATKITCSDKTDAELDPYMLLVKERPNKNQ